MLAFAAMAFLSIKITTEARSILKAIAQITGEKLYIVVFRLAQTELKRLQARAAKAQLKGE